MFTCASRSVPLLCWNKRPVTCISILYLSSAGMKTCHLNNLLNSIQLSNCARDVAYKCGDGRAYLTVSNPTDHSCPFRRSRNVNCCYRTLDHDINGKAYLTVSSQEDDSCALRRSRNLNCCYRTVDHDINIDTSLLVSRSHKCSAFSTSKFKERSRHIHKYCKLLSKNTFCSFRDGSQANNGRNFDNCLSSKNKDQCCEMIGLQHPSTKICSLHTNLLYRKNSCFINHQQVRKLSQFNWFRKRTSPYMNKPCKINYLQSDLDGNCIHFNVQKRTNYMSCWDGPEYRKQPPWRVLFLGTDLIALDTLTALHENMKYWSPVVGSLDVVTVKAQKPVREYAEKNGLPILDWPLKTDNSRYDVGVLVSFGHMIPDRVIHMFPYGILNMHPSLLPKWRGASPIIHAVLSGDTEMGVSVTEIRPKHFDIGPILMQRGFPMPHRPTSMQIADLLGKIGANMILETLQDLPTLERFEHEQDLSGVTYAHKISKQNGYINWDRSTAEDVDQHYRALSEIVPIRTMWKNQIVGLYDVVDPALLKDSKQWLHPRYKGDIDTALPGTPVLHRKLNCIVVKCKDSLIGFKRLKLRQMLTSRDFHNGYLNAWDGTIFTSVNNELYKFVRSEKMPVSSTG